MTRLVVADKPKPRLTVVELNARRRITPEEINTALEAERAAVVPRGGSPMSAYVVRRELFARHRRRS